MNEVFLCALAAELEKQAKRKKLDPEERAQRRRKLRVIGAGFAGQLIGSGLGAAPGLLLGEPATTFGGSVLGGASGRALATYLASGKAKL